jgi:hypothetical protein
MDAERLRPEETNMMRRQYRLSEPCVVAAMYTLSTSWILAAGGIGLAGDPFAAVAAMMAGIPWSLAVRWQPEAWQVGVFVTVVAMGLNIFGLWWWAARSRR